MLKKLNDIAKKIVKSELKSGKVDISLVNDKEIKRLNRLYRGKNSATDVLSFLMDEDGILGDIIISEETAKQNAKKFNIEYWNELKRLVIHGTLHLLGYDHIKKADRIIMEKKEDLYAKKIL